jgi:NDP-sugar pyrophosphorylase family protein
MKALVLSAGYGERLRPLTLTTPKPLLEIGGRPLVHYPLLMLRSAGITEVAVNVHYLANQIEDALGDGSELGISITYAQETSLTGTGGPLLALRDYFADGPFVITNADTMIDLDLSPVIDVHRNHKALATLVLRDGGNVDSYSRIEIDSTGWIRRMRLLKGRSPGEFLDYPPSLDRVAAASLSSYMYCGVMICQPEVLAILPSAPPFSLISDVFASALTEGFASYVHKGFFRTVDDLTSYEQLSAEFRSAEPPLRYIFAEPQAPS